jgi:NAD(P)-dependent dehydrogenase (short-subunit alcohol dehydrogenase family)
MNMLGREWYRLLKEEGVKVHIICPGRVATNFGGWAEDQARSQGATDVDLPVQFLKSILQGEKDGLEGRFIHQGGEYPF